MTEFSLVITSPREGFDCLALVSLRTLGVEPGIDALVAHAAPLGAPPANIRLLHCPGSGPLTLRRMGVAAAKHDWVIITESHCKLKEGIFQAYRGAIREHPDADLFFGGVVNETSIRPVEMANFLSGYLAFWPPTSANPSWPSIANLAVRKSALLAGELAVDGGMEALAFARLASSGRIRYCATALVDHVENNTLLEFCRNHFHNGRACLAAIQPLLGGTAWFRAWHMKEHCLRVLRMPALVKRKMRRAERSFPMLYPRLVLMGASHALGAATGFFFGDGGSHRKID